MIRFTLAAALGLGLALAPSAQQRTAAADADVPGAPLPEHVEGVGIEFFDDQDPVSRAVSRSAISSQASSDARQAAGSVSDADDPTFPLAFPASVAMQTQPVSLADGRDGAPPAIRVVTAPAAVVDEMTAVGRTPESLREARNRVAGPALAVEALDNGRPPGTRPGPVAVEEGAPVQRAAPLADAADGSSTAGLALSVVQPNPAHTEAWVTAAADAPTRATVTLYDIQGRRVLTAFDGLMASEAPVRVRLDLAAVSVGTYVVVLEADGVRSTQTVQVVR